MIMAMSVTELAKNYNTSEARILKIIEDYGVPHTSDFVLEQDGILWFVEHYFLI